MVLEEDEIVKLVRRHLDAVIEESCIEKHRMAVEFDGRRYESPEWLNSKVSACARLHGATMQKILNWIKRGNVSPDDFVEIPDFNNLKLIRNKTYELRKYQIIGTPIGT